MGIICSIPRFAIGMICSIWRGVHATVKNGAWDDPVEATTGKMYEDFKDQVAAKNLGPQVGPYLCWRYAYIRVAAFFSCMSIFLQVRFGEIQEDSLPNDITNLLEENYGIKIDDVHFSDFAFHWRYKGWYLLGTYVLSTLVLFVSLWFAEPKLAVRNRHRSARLVLVSWVIMFLAPFIMMLSVSMRGMIDWPGLEVDLCRELAMSTYRLQPVQITRTIQLVRSQTHLTLFPASSQVVPVCAGVDKLCTESLMSWCAASGRDGTEWSTVVNVQLAACALKVEEACRKDLCSEFPSIAPNPECYESCINKFANENLTRVTEWLSTQECTHLEAYLREGLSIDFDPSDPVTGLTQAAMTQRATVYALWQTSTSAGTSIELTVGLWVGGWTARLLMPAALSFMAGVIEGLLNVKICFPGQQHPVWKIAVAVLLPMPVYLGFLAVFQQIVGDIWFSSACLALSAFLCGSFITAMRSMEMYSNKEHRWEFYKNIWREYAFRMATFMSCVFLFITFFRFSRTVRSVVEDRWKNLKFTDVMALMASYAAQKGRIAVVFTDIFMNAHMRAELWRQIVPEDSFLAEQQTLKELGSLLLPPRYKQVFDHNEVEMTFVDYSRALGRRTTVMTRRTSIGGRSNATGFFDRSPVGDRRKTIASRVTKAGRQSIASRFPGDGAKNTRQAARAMLNDLEDEFAASRLALHDSQATPQSVMTLQNHHHEPEAPRHTMNHLQSHARDSAAGRLQHELEASLHARQALQRELEASRFTQQVLEPSRHTQPTLQSQTLESSAWRLDHELEGGQYNLQQHLQSMNTQHLQGMNTQYNLQSRTIDSTAWQMQYGRRGDIPPDDSEGFFL